MENNQQNNQQNNQHGHILGMILSELNSEIENINEQNEQNEPNKTSKAFIDSLEEIEMDKPNITCSICLDEFKLGDKCIQLPCKDHSHYFHNEKENCLGIKKWLHKSNTCPVCRTEFPKEESNIPETNQGNIVRQLDNRAQFILNSILYRRLPGPQRIIEMEEQRQLDAAIQASLEEQ